MIHDSANSISLAWAYPEKPIVSDCPFLAHGCTCLNLSFDNLNIMNQRRKPGRPRVWVLDDEIIEMHRLSNELRTQNPAVHGSSIKHMLKARLEQLGKSDLLLRFDRLWSLMKQVIPLPPPCICGSRIYSYNYRKVESKHEHSWEIFARCVNPNCRYMRRYLPSARYKWSRPESAAKEFEKTPTFYQMDGQKVEGEK